VISLFSLLERLTSIIASSTDTTFDLIYKTVENEKAYLKVWYQGTGPALILILGGGGDGGRFNEAIPGSNEQNTTVTYDRRGKAGSKVANPGPLYPIESARDVVEIIKVPESSKASIFGASSGVIIAFQVAASYPEYVEHVVIHEAPTVSLIVGKVQSR
jgi:pimeloyl-ACP methyl ester carboxylesterase